MAGIGFVLRNLTRQDDLMGLMAGYGYSALVATGPWIFTSVALGVSLMLGGLFTDFQEQATFRLIIIYNFAFSLMFSGPIVMVVTRYLSDMIYNKDVEEVPGMLVGSMVLMFLFQLPLVLWFYGFFVILEPMERLLAIMNYFLITGIWLVAVFLTALKEFGPIIRIFGIGMFLGMATNVWMAQLFGVSGMLAGFNLGLVAILFPLLARVFAEYPYKAMRPFNFLKYFIVYWELALGGLLYNVGTWIDKIIMWFSPQAEMTHTGMISYPNYDSAMFLAFLTIIPSMASFVISMETNFFEHYLKFYRDIQKHADFGQVKRNHKVLFDSVMHSGRNFLILQGSVSLIIILLAPQIFDAVGINYMQLGMFRVGVVGAFYHVMTLFLLIVLSYFDFRRVTLMIQAFFFAANTFFTVLTMSLGQEWYGYGYLFACLTTFVVAYMLLFHLLHDLPYQAFVRQNTSI